MMPLVRSPSRPDRPRPPTSRCRRRAYRARVECCDCCRARATGSRPTRSVDSGAPNPYRMTASVSLRWALGFRSSPSDRQPLVAHVEVACEIGWHHRKPARLQHAACVLEDFGLVLLIDMGPDDPVVRLIVLRYGVSAHTLRERLGKGPVGADRQGCVREALVPSAVPTQPGSELDGTRNDPLLRDSR